MDAGSDVDLPYALLALNDARPVDRSAPWSPSKEVGTGWFVFATVAAILTWADGWLLPWFSRRRPICNHPVPQALGIFGIRALSRARGRFSWRRNLGPTSFVQGA